MRLPGGIQPTRDSPLLRWLRARSGRRLLLAAVLLGCLFLAVWARIVPAAVAWQAGDRADRTVVAPRSATYVDSERTERLRAQAEAAVPLKYKSDPLARAQALQALEDFFAQAREVAEDPDLDTEAERVEALRSRIEFPVSGEALRLALATPEGTLQRVRLGTWTLVEKAMEMPIRDTAEDLERARGLVAQSAADLGFTERYTELAQEVAQAVLRRNLVQDLEATAAERKAARESVKEITASLRAGDVVISAGELVTQRHLDAFRALGLTDPGIHYGQAVAVLLLLAGLVGLLFAFLSRLQPELYTDYNRLVVLCATLAVAALVFRLGQASPYLEAYALSMAAAGAMLVSLIAGQYAGLVVAAFIALVFALIIPESNVKPVAIVMVAGALSAHLVDLRRTQTQTLVRTALTLAAANALLLAVGTEAFGQPPSWPLVGAGAVGGAAAALLSLGLALALDRPLNLLTDFRLSELASPQQPLLQRLLREAPGTYQSCVMVGALAEPVADALGLNGLLVRTGALYHDIGKLKRPYFFVENQFGGENPHDKLSPYMSALIIASHPRDGVEMAREAGLPPQIVAIIAQHQGTDLIRYFYEKAVEQAPEGTSVPEESFRYPGPKPRSKEAALLMLADTVEAASRTLDDPTPTRVERLVDRLFQARISDGQLDEAPLTFAELRQIRHMLVAGLNGVFHHRIKYPDQIPQEARVLAERLGPRYKAAAGMSNGVLPEDSDEPT